MGLLILHQGVSILLGSFKELTDASVPDELLHTLDHSLQPFRVQTALDAAKVTALHSIRAIQRGSHVYVNLVADVEGELAMKDAAKWEYQIYHSLSDAVKGVKEVSIKWKVITV